MLAHSYTAAILLGALALGGSDVASGIQITPMRVDPVQVRLWNRFADALYELHERQIEAHQIRSTEKTGGYSGRPEFYNEVNYYDAATGRLLSQIQWERRQAERIHAIEVNVYDSAGQLIRDYYARYLPDHRNAPVQTLINLHSHKGGLHAYRQFDASGHRIYEQCHGTHQGEEVFISLDEPGLTPSVDLSSADVSSAYRACFEGIPQSARQFLDPLVELPSKKTRHWPDLGEPEGDGDGLEALIVDLTRQIQSNPQHGDLYTRRGQALYALHAFDRAVDDFNRAIELDYQNDAAYFGRGMALAHLGDTEAGIIDLGVFIKRNPEDSLAYTKRGVRYIWTGDLEKAERDLRRAIELDPRNSEAHDDLGVILAQRRQYQQAIGRFYSAIDHDPTYQKAFHNLATTYYLMGDNSTSLFAVDHSLRLKPDDRNSLLLKSQILQTLGRADEARALRNEAERLPDGNESERLSID